MGVMMTPAFAVDGEVRSSGRILSPDEVIARFYQGVEVRRQMRPDEKREAMAAVRAGEVDVLVATTVIEVGVDVPNASIMIIESAERFGLSQLHQLRGRVLLQVGQGAEAQAAFARAASSGTTPP